MPYEEVRHTADLCIRVWSSDLPGLFSDAALGMYALTGIITETSPVITRRFVCQSRDSESLLVQFLAELLYIAENERIAFKELEIDIDNNGIHAVMNGTPIKAMAKTIKAVTYHNLKIKKTEHGVETELVFDV